MRNCRAPYRMPLALGCSRYCSKARPLLRSIPLDLLGCARRHLADRRIVIIWIPRHTATPRLSFCFGRQRSALHVASSRYGRLRPRRSGGCCSRMGIAQPAPEAVAPFNISRAKLVSPRTLLPAPLVITTEPRLFPLFKAHAALGTLPQTSGCCSRSSGLGLEFRVGSAWSSGNMSESDAKLYLIAAVLPPSFHFLTRRPSVYLVRPRMLDARVMVVARANPGVRPQESTKS